jgi:hypothetical protein
MESPYFSDKPRCYTFHCLSNWLRLRRSDIHLPDLAPRLPRGRELARGELRRLVTEIAGDAAVWQPLVCHDSEARYYLRLHRDPHVDVWLICWTNQQDVSAGAVHVCTGDLAEDRFELDEAGLRQITVSRPAGASFDFDASHVHRLRHPEGHPPAVSIHAYSPALWRMGYYDTDELGLLRRTSMTYADETQAA